MAAERQTVEVHGDWEALGGAARIGYLHAVVARGKLIFSFEYDEAWLSAGHNVPLDPGIHPVRGLQYVTGGRDNFGVVLDSSPDRWGRVLMQRREAQLAREERRAVRRLDDLDYLLGVYDGHRMGGLRYRKGSGPYLDDNETLASPPWTSLRELEAASLHLEREGSETDPKFAAWLRMLIAPGRSLGGSRPKASVMDSRGQLWLAKFPSRNDQHDVGGWESVVHELANRAGLDLSEADRARFGSRHHTFLTKRFDRSVKERLHFASAMTLLDWRDGEDGASYLDIAEVITRHGANPARDLEQLWRRIVFFVCVSNVDDHLRNHGFLLHGTGWGLAPAYDVNPNPDGNGLLLNISETDNAQDLTLVRDVAKHFRVKARRAEAIIDDVVKAVRGWREQAEAAGLSRDEREQMASAFRVANP